MYRHPFDLLGQVDHFLRDFQHLLGASSDEAAVPVVRAANDWVPTIFGGRASPRFNIADGGSHFTLEASLPGVESDDLEITVLGDELTVAGSWSSGKDESDAPVHRRERHAGKFSRTITLPADIDPDGVEALYRHGVLTLKIAKAESGQPRRIALSPN